MPNVPVQINLRGSVQTSRSEAFEPVLIVEDITPAIEPGRLANTISRRGGFRRDLTGNAQVDVAIEPDFPIATLRQVHGLSGYRLTNEARVPASDLRVTTSLRRIGLQPISANIVMEYQLRHVLSGGGTLEDRDDVVVFRTRRFEVMSVDLAPAPGEVFSIQRTMGREVLNIAPDANGGVPTTLCFGARDEALHFLEYLREGRQPFRVISNARISLGRGPGLAALENADLAGLEPVSGC